MKKIIICVFVLAIFISMRLNSQEKIRIGIYDSRCIAIWYFRTDNFKNKMKELYADMKKAKEEGDSSRIHKIDEKGKLMQKIAHDKGFGKGSVAEILENYNDVFNKIAKNNNLLLIASKWEINFSSEDVELVDITKNLLEELKASETIIKMSEQIQKTEPIKNAFFIDD